MSELLEFQRSQKICHHGDRRPPEPTQPPDPQDENQPDLICILPSQHGTRPRSMVGAKPERGRSEVGAGPASTDHDARPGYFWEFAFTTWIQSLPIPAIPAENLFLPNEHRNLQVGRGALSGFGRPPVCSRLLKTAPHHPSGQSRPNV